METILPYRSAVVEWPLMAIHVYSIKHDRHGLSEVERATAQLAGLTERVLGEARVRGAVVMATCNRVEVLADVDGPHLRPLLDEHFDADLGWDLSIGEPALRHVFEVAAGLDSMVVGEREIAGQLRRALAEAQQEGRASLTLSVALEEALRTSRQIANQTSLDVTGRSIVTEGIALLGPVDWAAARVLLIGTGSYAGAVVAQLRRLGARHISVHSASGRAAAFASSHDLEVAPELEPALRAAAVVVTCRGRGAVVFSDEVAPGTRLLDLSLVRDVDRSVESVAGVTVVDLAVIQRSIAPTLGFDDSAARGLIESGMTRTLSKLRGRVVDPGVTQLRATVLAMVDDEVARLPKRTLTTEDAAQALRRLATRLLHVPSSRAREAAEAGRANQYLVALHELYGIEHGPHPDELDGGRCPVTGFAVDDLQIPTNLEVS